MKWIGKKVGLALGGGGVRGLAHIGVINVLNREGIDIDLIVGTSAGSLIGGAYASGLTTREITAKVDAYLSSSEFDDSALKSIGMSYSPGPKSFFQKIEIYARNPYYLVRALFWPSILPNEEFQSLINYLIPDMDIRDTRIPFHAVATDLITGKQIVLSEGPLRQAVLASSSVPGAYEPIRLGQWLLADGGVTSLVPVHATHQAGADVVIAVMVDRDLPADTEINNAKDVLSRAGEITANALEAAEINHAEVVIRPEFGDLHWTDFSRAKDLVAIGEKAARTAMGNINGSLPLARRFSRFVQRIFKKKEASGEGGTPGSQSKSGDS